MRISTALVEGSINHRCGQFLGWHLQVRGDDTTMTVKENRFTLVSYFTSPDLLFKAHGARVRKCPRCGQALPKNVAEFRDEEFGEEQHP